jgi:hypothetical protein
VIVDTRPGGNPSAQPKLALTHRREKKQSGVAWGLGERPGEPVELGQVRTATGAFHQAGETGRVMGLHPRRASYGSFASFADPDGNRWFLQEITERLSGR